MTAGAGGPRLLAGLALIPVENGYLADGGPRRQLLSGRVTRELLPGLLPLLDGTRTVVEIAAALGEPAGRIHRVLGLLHQRDLAELESRPGADGQDPMGTYLRRRLPGGGGDRVRERLAGARVLVLGPDRLADPLAALIRRGGAGHVTRRSERGAAPDLSLVIQLRQPGQAGERGAPWLPVRHHGGSVHLGPLRNVAGGVCPLCTDEGPPGEAWETVGAALWGATSALTAAAALRFLGQASTRLARRVIELTEPGTPYREHVVIPRPDCPACGHRGSRLDGPALAEFAAEHSAEPPPPSWDPEPAPRDERGRPAIPKRYVTPAGVSTRAATGAAATVTWLLTRTVGEIGRRGNGSRPGPDRWVPSAAPPGSIRAYILGDLLGHGPGMHYFDPPADAYVTLPGPVPEIRDAAVEFPDADRFTVVLTGDTAGLGAALGPAGRRALLQDAGLAVAQIATGATAFGWYTRAGGDAAGELATALELDPAREFVAAVLQLAPVSPDRRAVTTATGRLLARRLRAASLAYHFDPRPVAAATVAGLAAQSLTASAAIWPAAGGDPAPQLCCVLHARRVDGLPPGLYEVTAGEPPRLLAEHAGPIEAYLRERALDPPAMLFFTDHLARTLDRRGAPGYPRLLATAATTAGLLRLTVTAPVVPGDALVTGLFAGFPAGLVCASTPARDPSHRVFYACALGYPAADSPPATGTVAW